MKNALAITIGVAAIGLASCGTSESGTRVSVAGLADRPDEGSILPEGPAQLAHTTTVPVTSVRPGQFVPPAASDDDFRTGLERYIGVPEDFETAVEWNHQIFEAAIQECMSTNGYDYITLPLEGGEDPNVAYLESASDEDRVGFTSLRYGVPELPPSGITCEDEAVRQVFVINAFAAEYAPFREAFYSDPRVIQATQAVEVCIFDAGESPDTASPATVEFCQSSADFQDTARKVGDELDNEFIGQYRTEIDEFVSNRPQGA
ncbi:MAG: hypothetical protein ACE37B_17255 [Ilumatobacter sp.]|uniref:hypothetical protein n=1 Tax=Ilumatobacter sp. TaxID=1967498 RepID=UPI003918D3C1